MKQHAKPSFAVECRECGAAGKYLLGAEAKCKCGNVFSNKSEKAEGETLKACAGCGSADLYIRKAMPKALGISVVVAAAIITIIFFVTEMVPPWAIYAPLFVAAAVDAILYMTTGDAIGCYHCKTLHYNCRPKAELTSYDLERAEEMRLGWKPGSRAKR
ncbi:MAG: hypothetical protein ACKVS6_02355 [Planctomycetota bacterium]